jgi:hypothetical protein
MQWSRLKSAVEGRFAASVGRRVQLRVTRYRHTHDGEGRGWITVDREEVFDASSLRHFPTFSELNSALQRQGLGVTGAHRRARGQLEAEGVYTEWTFREALEEYLDLSIERALSSTNVLHRGLAMIDRRLGQRRFRAIRLREKDHSLVRRLYRFRGLAEEWLRGKGDDVAA